MSLSDKRLSFNREDFIYLEKDVKEFIQRILKRLDFPDKKKYDYKCPRWVWQAIREEAGGKLA